MAKQSFFGKLAKGFIRSAVNQVGRDGGRVISNQVYGDSHSTPIRKTGELTSASRNQEPIIVDAGNAEYDAVISKELPLWIVAIVCTCGIASIIAFFKGLHYYRKKTVTYKRYEVEQVPIIDNRYKSGIRGYKEQTGYKYYEIPLNEAYPNDVKKQKTSALTLMVVSGLVFLCPAVLAFFKDALSNPILFITIPLMVLYVFAMIKPQIALDFINGSNVKRRIIATFAFLVLYGLAFLIKTNYFTDTQIPKTEAITNTSNNSADSGYTE